MGAVQMNTRIEEEVKAQGDAVLADYGISGTDAIRALWAYMAQTRTLPSFIASSAQRSKLSAESAEQGAGIALRIAADRGLHVSKMPQMSYEQIREAAWEEWCIENEEGDLA